MGGRSVGPHTAGQEGKEKATARRFSPLDCLFDLLLSSVSADNLYCSDMGVRGCPYRAMAFYQSYRFKSNSTFSHGVIARPGHPRTDCIFWNGAAFLFRLLSERQGASGCIFCSGASDRRAGTMCLSPSGRYSQKISTGKYAPLTPSNFPCCACLAESDSGKWTISPTRFRLAILARETARCLLCIYRLFPFLPLRSREMDGLFLSGAGTFTCVRRGPQEP